MWWFIAYLVVIVAAAFLLPTPEQPTPSREDFKAPTADEGATVPVVFGTRDIASPNLIWYGDVSNIAIRKKGGKK